MAASAPAPAVRGTARPPAMPYPGRPPVTGPPRGDGEVPDAVRVGGPQDQLQPDGQVGLQRERLLEHDVRQLDFGRLLER